MSASFIAVAFVIAVVLVNWRLLLLLTTACLVALMVFGLGIVTAGPPAGAITNPGVTQVQSDGKAVGRPPH